MFSKSDDKTGSEVNEIIDVAELESSGSGQPYSLQSYSIGTDVTEHINTIQGGISGLPMTVYQLQEPLLPEGRLLDFREYDGYLWFSGDTGLMSFELGTGSWRHITRNHGLPRDTAYQIEGLDDGVVLYLLDWMKEGHLGNNHTSHFNGTEFSDSPVRLIEAKNKSNPLPAKTALEGSTTDVVRAPDYNWYCVRGKHAGRDVGFQNGGVIRQSANGNQVREFGREDGMADAYCTSIARTEDDTVWISHWDEEAGLSYLPSGSERWETKRTSSNGIELGGPSVFAKGRYLFIAQQRGIVIYDPVTDHAYQILEEHGLPGFIVTDIQFPSDGYVWATSYRYGPGGRGQKMAGAVRFSFNDVAGLF